MYDILNVEEVLPIINGLPQLLVEYLSKKQLNFGRYGCFFDVYFSSSASALLLLTLYL